MGKRAETCDTFWGSHGCDLLAGHDPDQEHPIHVCFVRVYDEDGDVIDHDYCQRAQYVTAESSRVSYMQSDEETSDDLILEALLRVREIGDAGKAGPYVHRLPQHRIPNWGWLQSGWPVVVAVDVVQQAHSDQMTQLRALSEQAHTFGPDEFGAFKRELRAILGLTE